MLIRCMGACKRYRMNSNPNQSNENTEKILEIFVAVKDILNQYLTYIKNNENPEIRKYSNEEPFSKLAAFVHVLLPEYMNLVKKNFNIFENNDFTEILSNELNSLKSTIISTEDISNYALNFIFDAMLRFQKTFETIRLSIISLNNANNLIRQELQPAINEVKEKVKDFESLKLALEHRETNKIYLDLYKKYNTEYIVNNFYFFITVIAAIIFTLYTTIEISNFQQFSDYKTDRNFWVMFITTKVLIATVTLTFCTLFLRRLAHAKKLKEQAYQTHVEINAFPIHVRSLDKADKDELIKELAMKYFGKELDQTQNDKIGDLMRDQLAAGTELIKASAELVKAKGSSTPPS